MSIRKDFFFFQAEDGIRGLVRSRGLGDVYRRQLYLVLASTAHDSAQGFTIIMLWFVLPLLAVTIIAVTSYELGLLRGRKERSKPKGESSS